MIRAALIWVENEILQSARSPVGIVERIVRAIFRETESPTGSHWAGICIVLDDTRHRLVALTRRFRRLLVVLWNAGLG